MDRCETATTNSPGPGAGTGEVVISQSDACGSPDGRAASRTWWLIAFIVRLLSRSQEQGRKGNPAERTRLARMQENRARRVTDALRERGIDAHLQNAGVDIYGVRIVL